jgi:hypothetical protein
MNCRVSSPLKKRAHLDISQRRSEGRKSDKDSGVAKGRTTRGRHRHPSIRPSHVNASSCICTYAALFLQLVAQPVCKTGRAFPGAKLLFILGTRNPLKELGEPRKEPRKVLWALNSRFDAPFPLLVEQLLVELFHTNLYLSLARLLCDALDCTCRVVFLSVKGELTFTNNLLYLRKSWPSVFDKARGYIANSDKFNFQALINLFL